MKIKIHALFVFCLLNGAVLAQGLSGWSIRQLVTLTEQSGTTLTNYQIRYDLPHNPSMNADFSDVRFTLKDGNTLLDYWIETATNGVQATIWVEIPSLAASATDSIYLYYGNPIATSVSNGPATFIFFDDFSTVTGWNNAGNGTVVQDNTTFPGQSVLQKRGSCDPAGGWKSLGTTVTNFRLISREIRVGPFTDCPWNRYGLENASFNGYNLRRQADQNATISFGTERRNGSSPSNASDRSLPQSRGVWYRTELRRDCGNNALEAHFYDDSKAPIGAQINTDNAYCSFDRMTVRGGRDYFMDVVAVANYTTLQPVINAPNPPILLSTESLKFQLTTADKHTQLDWELETVDDLWCFDLEYSSDGTNFEKFARVGANGLAYSYTDPILRMGDVAYYRLKLGHLDGTISYSSIEAIRLEAPKQTLTFFPNPVDEQLTVRLALPTAGRYQLEVRSMSGQVLWTQAYDFQVGIHECTVPFGPLPSGAYSLHVRGAAVQLVRRVIKR